MGLGGSAWGWGRGDQNISGQNGRVQSEDRRPPFPRTVRVAMVSAEVPAELGCAVIPATAPPSRGSPINRTLNSTQCYLLSKCQPHLYLGAPWSLFASPSARLHLGHKVADCAVGSLLHVVNSNSNLCAWHRRSLRVYF